MGLTSDEPVDSVDESTREFAMHKAIKRIFDFVFALIAIVALTPVWVVLAVWIFLSSPGGVFFRQKRTGYRGETFEMLKFRSMYRNDKADEQQSTEGDPRVTPVGRFLRRSSLDELPQLWNVLKGDMSLIGPRPLLPQYLPLYSPGQARRHEVRPGITGWAQCNGRNALTWCRKFEYDVWYVDHISFATDCRIVWSTLKKTIMRDGINSEGSATTEAFNGHN